MKKSRFLSIYSAAVSTVLLILFVAQFSLMMLKNNIKNNFSQIVSTTMGQKVNFFVFFFDQNQLFYALLRDIQYKNCIFSKKIFFFIKIFIFFFLNIS
jgi:hypothetical protein